MGFDVFLKIPGTIIKSFGENSVLRPICIYIHIYIDYGGEETGAHSFLFIFPFLYMKTKNYINVTHCQIKFNIIYILNFIPGVNNKKVSKRGVNWGPHFIFYELSIVVLF